MLTSIIFMVALVVTISGCLIYSERLYVRLFPLLYLVGDIASVFKIPHAKIPRYNWGAWFLSGIAVLVFYWALGGDLPIL